MRGFGQAELVLQIGMQDADDGFQLRLGDGIGHRAAAGGW
jgi:hypothetical protein